MSKGPGCVMRIIRETIEAHPDRRFTIVELAEFAYPNAPSIERKHLVAVRAAVKKLPDRVEIEKEGTRYFRRGWQLKVSLKGRNARQQSGYFKAQFGYEPKP